MKRPIHINPTILLFVAALVLGCVGLSPTAEAQDGDELNQNTAEGFGALHTYIATANSSSSDTAIGFETLYNNTSGGGNTAIGAFVMEGNTSGNDNTAIGVAALSNNSMGNNNTATGVEALELNQTGDSNTATGFRALENNMTGARNTATGEGTLQNNTTGQFNTATGAEALINNNASDNTATGFESLFTNTSGFGNTATGFSALFFNNMGSDNTANGLQALFNNSNGNNNTATGFNALNSNTMGSNNTAEGYQALLHSTGSNNIAVGSNAGMNLTTGSNNIDIGAPGMAGEANKIRIGKVGTQNGTFIAGIHGVTVANTLQVVVDVNGHLGTVGSSERFKEAIKPMDEASEAVLALKPVTFRYKHELDPDDVPQFGLVAEQVEKVNPDLVARDASGKVYTVRYEAVNAMLLNEFLKEHHKVEEQQKEIAALGVQLKQQAALIQKVSDRLEATKGSQQLVANN